MTTKVRAKRPGEVGPLLRDLRRAADLTQADLADRAQVGRQWLNAFERGDKASAPLDMVMRVAAALDARLVLAHSTKAGRRD